MKDYSIKFGQNHLSYRISGAGQNFLLAFHGFGQNASIYDSFEKNLSNKYTILSFDIFYHGNSDWKEKNKALTKSDWKQIVEKVLSTHGISTFAVCGYSMGGKFAMATLEAFQNSINQFILIAPDGVKTSFWYSLATYPIAFRKFFRAMITQPKYFQHLLRFSKNLGLVDKSLIKFANSQMNTRAKRRRVYLAWVMFRHLTFNLKNIAGILNQHQIPTYMITGKYDKIITSGNMMNLLTHVNEYENIILESGHNSLIADTAVYFRENPKKLKFKID
ncbi:hypothetical protein GCM10011506_21180 [Marivirga lumbricoides]|uniref:AB hydrolase-1 domain-containing protein n=1 Tax=Marivirga lumbricoides TaxID=1046115 RepID=A0ABQ1M6F7_9BACT|nr:hypothetical protein GCM10011506_21180 [Marivirga lumbricoides]